MKLKHLRDAINNRLKDLDGEYDVEFIHKAEQGEDGKSVKLVCRHLTGILQQGKTVYIIPPEVADFMQKDISESTSGGLGITNLTIDQDVGLMGVEFKPKKEDK